MRTLMHIIEDRMLRAEGLCAAASDVRGIKADLDHVPGTHAPALGHAVDQGLVEVEDQRLHVFRVDGLLVRHVGRLASRDQRPRRRRRLRIPCQRGDG